MLSSTECDCYHLLQCAVGHLCDSGLLPWIWRQLFQHTGWLLQPEMYTTCVLLVCFGCDSFNDKLPHYVGGTVLWYQLEGGGKSCRHFDHDAPVFFKAKMKTRASQSKCRHDSHPPSSWYQKTVYPTCFRQLRSPTSYHTMTDVC